MVKKLGLGIVLFTLALSAGAQEEGEKKSTRILTHADAAVLLAKYSGYFDRYLDKDAGLQECVRFLNTTGIYFGLMQVVNGSEFTLDDCARSMGQIDLVLSGEAEYIHGKVKLPKGIDTWAQFCTMNGVNYKDGHKAMLEILLVESARMN